MHASGTTDDGLAYLTMELLSGGSLADRLTAAVEIRVQRKTKRGEQGEIAISFGSLDELNGLLDKLGVTDR